MPQAALLGSCLQRRQHNLVYHKTPMAELCSLMREMSRFWKNTGSRRGSLTSRMRKAGALSLFHFVRSRWEQNGDLVSQCSER